MNTDTIITARKTFCTILSIEVFPYSKVEDLDTLWDWMESVLVPVIYPEENYNGDLMSKYHRSFMSESVGYRLYPMQLRQLRIKKSIYVYWL